MIAVLQCLNKNLLYSASCRDLISTLSEGGKEKEAAMVPLPILLAL